MIQSRYDIIALREEKIRYKQDVFQRRYTFQVKYIFIDCICYRFDSMDTIIVIKISPFLVKRKRNTKETYTFYSR